LIQFSTLERLKELEQQALEKVGVANAELIEARESVNRLTSGIPAGHTDEDVYDPTLSKKTDGPNVTALEEAGNSASARSSIRQRAVSASLKKWHQAQVVVGSIQNEHKMKFDRSTFCGGFMKYCSRGSSETAKREAEIATTSETGEGQPESKKSKRVVNILEHPTYAVITFTSRQAAIAARQCLADGGGVDRWIEIEELPVAPLADAPPCDIMFCRGCCKFSPTPMEVVAPLY
jgi:hypothetical protein